MTKRAKKGEPLSISALAKQAGVHRATARDRLERAKIEPVQEKAKEKLYDADEALKAVQGDDRSGLRKAQTIKTATEAARSKLKLEKEKGELVPLQDVRVDLQAIVNEIRLHFLTRAAALAPQLRGQKVARIEAMLTEDAEQFFNNLRAEHEGYLSEAQAED